MRKHIDAINAVESWLEHSTLSGTNMEVERGPLEDLFLYRGFSTSSVSYRESKGWRVTPCDLCQIPG